MEKSYLIERIERDCPLCNKIHLIEKRKRKSVMLIKGEKVAYEEIYFFCPDSVGCDEDEFVSAKLMNRNLQNARDAYRKSHGLLTSREIAEIRSLYGMSQADLAALLGLGEVTITRYESKSVQDETYDQLIRMVKDDPYYALKCLKKQKERFTPAKYEALNMAVRRRIGSIGFKRMTLKNIENYYAEYDTPCEFNGYRILDIDKLGATMAAFAQYFPDLYAVKLMKLLWYADALSYMKRGHAITGLVYRHTNYGALPLAHAEIVNLPQFDTEEIEEDDGMKCLIRVKRGMDLNELTEDEIEIIHTVADEFRDITSGDMAACMRDEAAYKETEMHQVIPFSLCEKLNRF